MQLAGQVTLRDGRRLPYRALRPDDAERLRRFGDGLSARSRYQRFHQPMAQIPASLLERLTHLDVPRECALVCEHGDEIIAVARYAPHTERSGAEFALVVADAWQRMGLGRALLRKLCDAARAAGYQAIYGTILYGNVEMLELTARLGFVPHASAGGEITVVLRL